MEKLAWKVLKKEDVSPSKWFPVVKEEVQLPNGQIIEYFRSQLANVAMVIPITKEGEVVFVRQYKHGIGEVCIEFPAGRVEENNSVVETAIRELLEETGIVAEAQNLVELAELWTEPSKSSVRVTGFLATNLSIDQKQNLEETEDIEILKVPVSEIDTFISKGEIHASDTLALLLLAKMKFPKIFITRDER